MSEQGAMRYSSASSAEDVTSLASERGGLGTAGEICPLGTWDPLDRAKAAYCQPIATASPREVQGTTEAREEMKASHGTEEKN